MGLRQAALSPGYPQAELLAFLVLVYCVNIQDPVKSMGVPEVFAHRES